MLKGVPTEVQYKIAGLPFQDIKMSMLNLLHQPASKFLLGSAPVQLDPELLERVFLHILFYSPQGQGQGKHVRHALNKSTISSRLT